MQRVKSFNLNVLVIAFIALGIAAGCTKAPAFKADPVNPYANPNPPDNSSAGPIILDFSPKSGLAYTVVTLSGNYFDTNPANTTVTVNGLAATINSISTTKIVFTVPAGATTGDVVLKSGTSTLTSTSRFVVKTGTVSTFLNLGSTTLQHISFDAIGDIFGENDKLVIKASLTSGINVYAGANNMFGKLCGSAINIGLNEVYVADSNSYNVYKIAADKTVTLLAGTGKRGFADGNADKASFNALKGLAMDPNGNIYVIDGFLVRKVTNSGTVSILAGSDEGYRDTKGAAARFGNLQGIAADADGNVYVSDAEFFNIRKIAPDGTVTTLAGSGTAGFTDGAATEARFNRPTGLAIDASGNLFVADANKAQPYFAIRVINKFGVVSTLLKGTSLTGVINGPVATASVNAPNGLVFDIAGNLYISNTGANIISKVTF